MRHSGADSVQIAVDHAGGMLRATITDDGTGGADPARGTGLSGVERRLATFDGILAISSPAGGPTIVAIELPCPLPGGLPDARRGQPPQMPVSRPQMPNSRPGPVAGRLSSAAATMDT